MPIYFLLSKRVLLSVGREPTLQAYFERGALFYNALTNRTARLGECESFTPASCSILGRRSKTMTGSTETAILAGGCFWGMQDLLRRYPGVISTRVGAKQTKPLRRLPRQP